MFAKHFAAALVALVLIAAGCGDDDSGSGSATSAEDDHEEDHDDDHSGVATETLAPSGAQADVSIELTVDESGHVGSVVQVDVSIGDVVEITVRSAVDDELHVHAYDHTLDLEAGDTAVLKFEAVIPGVFEVELEGSGVKVIELTVS